MDKRNRPALAYLLVGVASAGRAMLAMPDAVALQEVSLTVLALVGYLLLGRRALPVLLRHRAVGAGTGAVRHSGRSCLAGPAAAGRGPVAAGATVTQMLKIAGYTTGKNAKMPVVAAVPLAVYCVAHFFAVAATVASFCLHRVQHHAAVVRRAAAARLQHHPREKVSPRLVKTGIVCYTI